MRWIVTYITGMRKSLLTYHLDPPVLSPAKQWVAGYASGHGRPLSHTPRSSWLLLSCLCVFTKCWRQVFFGRHQLSVAVCPIHCTVNWAFWCHPDSRMICPVLSPTMSGSHLWVSMCTIWRVRTRSNLSNCDEVATFVRESVEQPNRREWQKNRASIRIVPGSLTIKISRTEVF